MGNWAFFEEKTNKSAPGNSKRTEAAKTTRRRPRMKEMIVIRALENGIWEIQVLVKKSKDEIIERGKRCRI